MLAEDGELHLDEEGSPEIDDSFLPKTPQRARAVGKYRYLKPPEVVGLSFDFALIVNRAIRKKAPSSSCLPCFTTEVVHEDEEQKGLLSHCLQSSSRLLQESEGDYHRQIVDKLCAQGLLVDIIDGGHSEGEMTSDFFILLIRASDRVLKTIKREYKLKNWTNQGNISDFAVDFAEMETTATPAERIEMVHDLIQNARFTTKDKEWIHDMFPVHDEKVTEAVLQRVFSMNLFNSQTTEFIDSIRYNFGEKVAYYFAFIKFYNRALIPIAALGIVVQFFKTSGLVDTVTYMRLLPYWGLFVSVVWSFLFLKSWDQESVILQYEWNRKIHTKPIEHENLKFNAGETHRSTKRIFKFGLMALFMLFQTIVMLLLVAMWVSIYEVIKVHYPDQHIFSQGWFLILLEGIVFGFFVDFVQWKLVVTRIARFFSHWENYRTEEKFEQSLIRKLFIMDFLNYYTWFFSLAFIFVIPGFGDYLTNYLNHFIFGDEMNCCFGPYVDTNGDCNTCPTGESTTCIECLGWFTFDRHHVDLSTMFVTPIVITQILNIVLELTIPWVVSSRRTRARKAADNQAHKKVMEAGSMKILGTLDYHQGASTNLDNQSQSRYLEYSASEIEVLNKKARDILFESEQDSYDPYNDFHVLTVQFGFTVMFSILWPLMPLACYLINLLKLRADGYRLCKTLKRPFPRRAIGIGDWRNIFYAFAFVAIFINVALICVSTGALEFYLDICVKDFTHRLEKQGKTLEDFVLGPDFGCLHFTWRLIFIMVLEHICMAGALLLLYQLPGIPKWVQEKALKREIEFKKMLRDKSEHLNLHDLMPTPKGTTTVAGFSKYNLLSKKTPTTMEENKTSGTVLKRVFGGSPEKAALQMHNLQVPSTENSKERLASKWSTESPHAL